MKKNSKPTDFSYLESRLLLWKTLYIITSGAFVTATGYLCYMTIYELLNGGNPLLFITGNIANIVLCLVLLLVATFFGSVHEATRTFLDRKIKELTEPR